MKKIGLFFGSFNPIHIGHLIIANFMATQTDLNEVWFVVSPHNPLKPKATLARDRERLHMVQLAIESNHHLKVSDVEFYLPKPSYTIDTLAHLKEKYPNYKFILIMGGDNLATINKWKNYELILQNYPIYVYKRPTYDISAYANHPSVSVFDVPLMEISATYIRNCIAANKSIQYLVPDEIFHYISGSNMYK
ncbi:MAG: nicotinate-nucleotide adenylyltransferase [Saprospiraceae bacterium]|nr:nicotinate-nucleotide adenylyltransferase [Saprospiraceae bacterium]